MDYKKIMISLVIIIFILLSGILSVSYSYFSIPTNTTNNVVVNLVFNDGVPITANAVYGGNITLNRTIVRPGKNVVITATPDFADLPTGASTKSTSVKYTYEGATVVYKNGSTEIGSANVAAGKQIQIVSSYKGTTKVAVYPKWKNADFALFDSTSRKNSFNFPAANFIYESTTPKFFNRYNSTTACGRAYEGNTNQFMIASSTSCTVPLACLSSRGQVKSDAGYYLATFTSISLTYSGFLEKCPSASPTPYGSVQYGLIPDGASNQWVHYQTYHKTASHNPSTTATSDIGNTNLSLSFDLTTSSPKQYVAIEGLWISAGGIWRYKEMNFIGRTYSKSKTTK